MSLQQDLMTKWKPVKELASHIFTWTGDGEMAYLAEMATRARLVVEIGTHMGASAFTMLTANPRIKLICIDPFIYDGTYETARHHLRQQIQFGHCVLIRKRSADGLAEIANLADQVDFAFIDGAHDYETVVSDVRLCMPLMHKGGVMSGHDYDNEKQYGVKKAVTEVLPGHYSPVPNMWAYDVP